MVRRKLTEADTLTIRLGSTPSGLTSAHLYHPPIFLYGRVTTLPGKSWNLLRPFSRPGKSWKTARSWKVMENDDDVLEFFVKMH